MGDAPTENPGTLEVPVPNVGDLDRARLTDMLRDSGALSAGQAVERVVTGPRMRAGAMGAVHPMTLEYSAGVQLPTALVYKRTRPDLKFDALEVRFYRELARELPAGIAPRCLAARHDEKLGQYFLLLEDLGQTHQCLLGRELPPIGPERVGQAVDALATLHAARFEGQLLGFGERANDPAATTRRSLPWLREHYPRVRRRLGERLQEREDALYRRYLELRSPELVRRLEARRGFALLHGDPHVGNVLFPREGTAEGAMLIDWGIYRMGPCTWDLAFHLLWTDPACWSRETSAGLLRRYHQGLLERGVADYPYARCEDDFRHALLDGLRTPLSQLAASHVPDDVAFGAHTAVMVLIDAWDRAELL
ncbi:MAG: aminoglycoside phosphotransferase family protein [Myxococcales bacterium]|nr:aminoglycoside phosphotransferase family protein [Myxococcales bacterium]